MKRTILSEDERRRILNLHKKVFLVENPIPYEPTPGNIPQPVNPNQYKEFEDMESILAEIKRLSDQSMDQSLKKQAEEIINFMNASKGKIPQNPIIRKHFFKGLNEFLNSFKDNNNSKPNSQIPSCDELLRARNDGTVGSGPEVKMNGNVVVSNFIDGGPSYNAITFDVNGKPFCRVAIKSIGDCKFQAGDRDAPGSSPYKEFTGEVTLSKFIDGGPRYQSYTIENNGNYFCKFN